jgi:ABC-type antimicrobial peptide transport system permease subunit
MKDQAERDYGTINSFSQLWIQLRPDANEDDVQKRLTELAMGKRDKEEVADEMKTSFNLQPLSEVHFDTEIGVYDESRDQANKNVLISLIFVALFLILLAVVNFINLNTASATQRAGEIGVRKTLGSSRTQLIYQFLGETFLLTLFAFAVSLGMSFLLLKIFSDFVVDAIDLSLLIEPELIAGMIGLIIVVTLLSGFYPAMVLSGFKPSRVLKGGNMLTKGNTNVRKGLTVFQFVIAQVFIIGTLLVGKQIKFMMYADMGFEKEQRIFINTPWRESDFSKKQALEQKIAAISGVEMTSLGNTPPASNSTYMNDIKVFNGQKEVKLTVRQLFGDTKFLNLYEIPILAGRQPLNDTINEFMLNEKAVRELGFANMEDVLNEKAMYNDEEYTVVGILPDFKQNSLHNSIMSLAFMNDTARSDWGNFHTAHVRINVLADLKKIIDEVEKAYLEVYPNETPSIHFLDEEVAAFYRKDQQLEKLLNWATGLSILISCLGLLGLVVHTTERRRKEIGVRKVLGATVAQINTLLCKDFVLLIVIAFVIAAPIAYYFIQDYLNDFVFRTDISIWIFLGSIAAMTLIALAVMSIKTVSTAMRNPVESLKTE